MSTGLVLGKFLPPHLGHQYLIDFARHYVDELTVLVCTLDREPIPGHLRFQWMAEMFPHKNVRLIHVTDDLPQTPEEHPNFWPIWLNVIRRHIPAGPDYVFASEPYGFKLAEVVGGRYIPVDHARQVVPVSGTAIRQSPLKHWQYLPGPVRPYYLKRICLFGPESTGKTTLAARLAEHFQTAWVPEHARSLLDHKNGICAESDIPLIARGQVAAEDAMARQASRLLICDTDPLLTTIWSEVLFGSCPQLVRALAQQRTYDLYLLMDIDCPWVQDGQRYLPDQRQDFFDRCRTVLDRSGRPYTVIQGDWEQRFAASVAAVNQLVSSTP